MDKFRAWSQSTLETNFALDAEVLYPYLVSALEAQDQETLTSFLASIKPDCDEECWSQFCRDLPVYYTHPERIRLTQAGSKLDQKVVVPQDDHQQPQQQHPHHQKSHSAGYGLLEELCHSVAEAALFGGEEEEEEDGHISSRRNGKKVVITAAEEKGIDEEQHHQLRQPEHYHHDQGWGGGGGEIDGGYEDDAYHHHQAGGMGSMMMMMGGMEGQWGQHAVYLPPDPETYMDEIDEEVMVRESILGVLMDAFPQCDPGALMMVLDRCGLDIDSTVSCVESALRPFVPPCRYFLSGFCGRSDCIFSHEFEGTTCIYWLLGTCRGGGNTEGGGEEENTPCPFLHDVIAPPLPTLGLEFEQGFHCLNHNKKEEDENLNKLVPTEENFPSLSSAASTSTSKKKAKSSSSSSLSSPELAAASSSSSSTASPLSAVAKGGGEGGKSFLQALSTATANGKKSSTGIVGGGASSSGSMNGSSSSSSLPSSRLPAGAEEVRARMRAGMDGGGGSGGGGRRSSSNGGGVAAAAASRKVLEALWVMGGEDVKKQYQVAREEASIAARARNAFFMRATEAFQRGDKAAAKNLGQQGRSLNALMKARHKEAALAIFASRNQSEDRIYEQGILDLHGLHVSEALEALDELLPDLIHLGVKEATLITGSGHHSGAISGGQSRLLPAVEGYVQELNATYHVVADPNGHKGSLCVQLTRDMAGWWG